MVESVKLERRMLKEERTCEEGTTPRGESDQA